MPIAVRGKGTTIVGGTNLLHLRKRSWSDLVGMRLSSGRYMPPTDSLGESVKSEDDEMVEIIYDKLRRSLKKAEDANEKKRNSLEKEMDKAKSLEATMKRANLIVSNLYQLPDGTRKIVVQDWENNGEDVELILDYETYPNAKEEADALFTRARKMKRGSKIVEDLLLSVEEKSKVIKDFQQQLIECTSTGLDMGRLLFIQESIMLNSAKTGIRLEDSVMKSNNNNRDSKTKQQHQSTTRWQPTFRRFKSPNGCTILVGRNRRDNEAICFQVSKATDVWMHARGVPGAHVLLQVRRGSPKPEEECFTFAANLAAFYSDARSERKTPITCAYAKHIQKPRGAPMGAVKVREETKTLLGFPNEVPEECKIAREQSGAAWDESGTRSLGGKAKNRKWTKANTKQNMEKIRNDKRSKKKRRDDSEEGMTFY